ncbi:MAG TPA: hypothetical protein VJY63_03800 [Marinospirillum sp.]|uniref:hypothetical protein n=1 Tax=Marinospirillum sp. TaxID=2183934 RepID=UPI002B49A0B6|nr:hypothetical protein [Marinospirillum sp.]HKM15035.1 hypothetical protein [Marinospirillum sp.]
MVLSPLAVILLAQLVLVLLGIIAFQALQRHRLVKELKKTKAAKQSGFDLEQSVDAESFDRQQAELLLNRILQNTKTIISEAPAAKVLCENQQALLYTLSNCINIPLDSSSKKTAAVTPIIPTLHESNNIISQEEIDDALGREEAIESFDFDNFDNLENNNNDTENEDSELPEDSVQLALDKLNDFDMDDFENQLNKM